MTNPSKDVNIVAEIAYIGLKFHWLIMAFHSSRPKHKRTRQSGAGKNVDFDVKSWLAEEGRLSRLERGPSYRMFV